MDHLIIKYLNNEISLEERHQLSKWVDSDEKNAKILEKMELYWAMEKTDYSDEKSEVFQRLIEEIRPTNRLKTESTNGGVRKWHVYLARTMEYAAVIAVLCVLSLIIFEQSRPQPAAVVNISYVEKVCLPGQKITARLPDGTMVKLNAGSKIVFPSVFVSGRREVLLEGEGFFDVVRDESKPFIVNTSQLNVEVLGTSFNVKAYGKDQNVTVKTGKVKVQEKSGKDQVFLNRSEQASLTNSHLHKSQPDLDFAFGWVDKRLVFKKNTLRDVFTTMENWFDVKFLSLREVKDLNVTCTASYDNPTLEEVMASLSFIYKFDYKINGNEIELVN